MVLPERVSSISPKPVIGSTSRTVLVFWHGISTLVETLDQIFVDEKAGKTVDIDNALLDFDRSCFGNSDGDLEPLRYMTIGNPSQSLGMIICHTDENRDFTYDSATKKWQTNRGTASSNTNRIVSCRHKVWLNENL